MAVARGVAKAVHPVKMNYEIHGNTIPHLHMHLFPRTPDDPYVGYVITEPSPDESHARADRSHPRSAVRAELAS